MKRILCLILAAILLFSLAACEKDQKPSLNSGETAGENTGSNEENNSGENNETPNDKENPDENPDSDSSDTETGDKETRYFITSEEQTGEDGYKHTWTYDNNGNMLTHSLQEVHYIAGEKCDYSYSEEFAYDALGNLILEKGTAGYLQNAYHHTYTYNNLGQRITQTSYQPDGSIYRTTIYSYDEKGNLIKEAHDTGGTEYTYHKSGKVLTVKHFGTNTAAKDEINEYDEQGNLLSATTLDGDNVYRKLAWTYDSKGNILTFAELSGKGIRYSYTYDEQGNKLTEITYILDVAVSGESYTYDAQGNMLTKASLDPETMERSNTYVAYTYDSHGNMLTAVLHESDGTTLQTHNNSYTYDDAGNLIHKVEGDLEVKYTYIAIEVPNS